MSYIVQQVRSTEEGKRPRAEQLAEGQLAVNVNNASPGVFLRTTTDKVVKVGGTSVGPTTPFAVYNNEYSTGELWYNTTDNDLKIFDGANFVSASSGVKALADFKAGAPNALLTLQAVATALGNDPARATTVNNRLQAIEDAAATLSNLVDSNELSRTIGQGALQTALDDEAVLRSQADTAIGNRLAVLEVDPTTATDVTTGDATTLSSANTYTDTAIAGLVGTAGTGLDTLGEIAAALGGDSNFATNNQDALDLKAPLNSPIFTGGPQAPTVTAGTNNNVIATTAFVTTAVDNLINSAPGALDTLNELAAALGDDANFATTVTNSIAAVQADVDTNEADADAAILELDGNVNDLITLSGVAENATDLGTFTGTTIADSSTLKAALQALETAQEATQADVDQNEADADSAIAGLDSRIAVFELDPGPNGATFTETDTNVDDLITLSGVAENSADLGTFTGSTIADSSTVKGALQSLETALELKADASAISNVDNTSDADKPISTATQTALDLKADSTVVTEIDGNVDDLVTLSGVAENTANLGTFTGSILSDNLTVKAALQEVEDDLAKAIHLDGANMPGPYNNDTDAGTGGVPVGGLYKNSNGTVHWRVS